MIDFLRSVLPACGNYVLHTYNGHHSNKHAGTLEELEKNALALDAHPDVTVWFALANYKDNLIGGAVKRTQALATSFKTLAFDVDPKDSKQNVLYADQPAMVRTTREACGTIGIPPPVFINSGNGIHCYFPLTVEIPKAKWVELSSLLKDALLATGMALDTSKICDPSMVLRPPGTSNKKGSTPKPVKLLGTLKSFDPLVLEETLRAYVTPAKRSPAPIKGNKRTSAVMDAILAGDFPPGDSALIALRCPQIAAIAGCGGNVQEPLWRLALGLAKHCIEPEATAVKWSDQHPEYDEQKTLRKMAAWEYPATTCKKFEEIEALPCKNCQHRNKIGSPIQLGVDAASDPVVAAPTPGGMRVPKGYVIRGETILFIDADGEAHFVSDYLFYPSARYKDHHEGKSVAVVEMKLPLEGWQSQELPMSVLAKTAEFSLWLMNHQLFVQNEGSIVAMRKYMLTYMQELQQETESDPMSSSFGWTDGTCSEFVLGTRLVKAVETGNVRLANTAADFSGALIPKGDKAEWAAKTAMFNEPGMQLHGLVFLMSVGSPLMVGSGLKSVLVNLYSKDSGTGKTTTGLYANSAYGNPERLKMTVKDTDNSLFKSMGVYGNLPVYIDEITEACKVPGRLGQIAYFVTQGREKRRMNKDGGFQESVEWESISTASSNKDIYSQLGDQDSYEGQSMRILQFTVTHTPLFPKVENHPFGYEMAHFLNRNHGLIGEDFVRGIVQLGGPHAIFAAAREQFKNRYDFAFTGKERFWQAAMIIAFATGRIMKSLGLSVVDYDACIEAGLLAIRGLRKEMVEEKMDCFDTLGLYMGEHASKTVVHKRNTTVKSDGAVVAPYPHEAVARIEAVCTNSNPFTSGRLFINQVHFNTWCHERGVDRKSMVAELTNHGVAIHKDRRIALMRGTDKPLPAVRVFEVDMSHTRFLSIMQQNDLGVIPTDLRLVKEAK